MYGPFLVRLAASIGEVWGEEVMPKAEGSGGKKRKREGLEPATEIVSDIGSATLVDIKPTAEELKSIKEEIAIIPSGPFNTPFRPRRQPLHQLIRRPISLPEPPLNSRSQVDRDEKSIDTPCRQIVLAKFKAGKHSPKLRWTVSSINVQPKDTCSIYSAFDL